MQKKKLKIGQKLETKDKSKEYEVLSTCNKIVFLRAKGQQQITIHHMDDPEVQELDLK